MKILSATTVGWVVVLAAATTVQSSSLAKPKASFIRGKLKTVNGRCIVAQSTMNPGPPGTRVPSGNVIVWSLRNDCEENATQKVTVAFSSASIPIPTYCDLVSEPAGKKEYATVACVVTAPASSTTKYTYKLLTGNEGTTAIAELEVQVWP